MLIKYRKFFIINKFLGIFMLFTIDPASPMVLYAGKWAPRTGASNGMFKSVDRGITWRQINYNLGNNLNIREITIKPSVGAVC